MRLPTVHRSSAPCTYEPGTGGEEWRARRSTHARYPRDCRSSREHALCRRCCPSAERRGAAHTDRPQAQKMRRGTHATQQAPTEMQHDTH
eukprot:12518660-Alexandrium_andersonii.AAC.1